VSGENTDFIELPGGKCGCLMPQENSGHTFLVEASLKSMAFLVKVSQGNHKSSIPVSH